MKKINSDDVLGISFLIMFGIFMAAVLAYIAVFDIIYQDRDGNPVVCDVEGIQYQIERPECQIAMKGRWRRDSDTIWQGVCDSDGFCHENRFCFLPLRVAFDRRKYD